MLTSRSDLTPAATLPAARESRKSRLGFKQVGTAILLPVWVGLSKVHHRM